MPNEMTADILRAVFHVVCDKKDWKAPIRCIVHKDTAPVVQRAVEFMTATTCDVTTADDTGHVLVTSIGYRRGPAGDH